MHRPPIAGSRGQDDTVSVCEIDVRLTLDMHDDALEYCIETAECIDC